jgi:Asp-tRNA(Asn)/Glu-tRNA(Gln) amidotransferase A subunit family amidase
MDFRRQSLEELSDGVSAGQLTAVELTRHALAQIESLDGRIHAFVAVDAERALAEAASIDARREAGEEIGPLAGIPIAVKDLEAAAGFVTTLGSALHTSDPPARQDSILVRRLREAGCVVVGKTNTPEHGAMPDTVNRAFPATRNPWNLERSPGGSSGGSAAAVAAGMVPLATGSDGGGSLRIPSSCCGLSGMKTSHGRVPSGGPEPPGWLDLSTKGLIARRVSDLAYGLDAVIGPDPTDLRSLPLAEVSWRDAVREPHVPVAVAWSPTLGYAPVDDEVLAICERAVDALSGIGATITEVEHVFTEDPLGTWMTLVDTCNWRTLSRYHGTDDWSKLEAGLAAGAERGRAVSGADIVRAQDECHRMNVRLVNLFRHHRLLVTPTLATAPPPSGGLGTVNGDTDLNWVRFTYPFNCTRSPAATVCAGFTQSGLPVGLQLVGPQHADQVVLRAAAALEAALDLDTVAPLPAPA